MFSTFSAKPISFLYLEFGVLVSTEGIGGYFFDLGIGMIGIFCCRRWFCSGGILFRRSSTRIGFRGSGVRIGRSCWRGNGFTVCVAEMTLSTPSKIHFFTMFTDPIRNGIFFIFSNRRMTRKTFSPECKIMAITSLT